ncbi:MAG: GNAT family N-acetyltransferase [Betaproteobacteria bacterium]
MTGAATDVSIRRAVAADADALSAVLHSLSAFYLASPDGPHAARYFAETSPARMREAVAAPDIEVYIAEIDGEFAGFVSTQAGRRVLQFYVERRFQGRRVGRALWNQALAALAARGPISDITVDASVFAVPVYGRFGFEIAGERTTENGLTYVPMILRAAPAG